MFIVFFFSLHDLKCPVVLQYIFSQTHYYYYYYYCTIGMYCSSSKALFCLQMIVVLLLSLNAIGITAVVVVVLAEAASRLIAAHLNCFHSSSSFSFSFSLSFSFFSFSYRDGGLTNSTVPLQRVDVLRIIEIGSRFTSYLLPILYTRYSVYQLGHLMLLL